MGEISDERVDRLYLRELRHLPAGDEVVARARTGVCREAHPRNAAERGGVANDAGGAGRRVAEIVNTSGVDYRALGLGAKLPGMSEAAALELLASTGNLVKRPFLLRGDGAGLVGFNESAWAEALLCP